MEKFQIGDEVECFRLDDSFFKERLGQVAMVLGYDAEYTDHLKLSEPFNVNSCYDARFFRVFNPILENE